MLNTAQADDCCKPLRAKNLATLESWTCKRCGCEWRPVMVGPVRHWVPVESALVFQLPETAARE